MYILFNENGKIRTVLGVYDNTSLLSRAVDKWIKINSAKVLTWENWAVNVSDGHPEVYDWAYIPIKLCTELIDNCDWILPHREWFGKNLIGVDWKAAQKVEPPEPKSNDVKLGDKVLLLPGYDPNRKPSTIIHFYNGGKESSSAVLLREDEHDNYLGVPEDWAEKDSVLSGKILLLRLLNKGASWDHVSVLNNPAKYKVVK